MEFSESENEQEIPSGWRQQCSQGHRTGMKRKCKLNNHGSIYFSPDGAKFDDLDSVNQFLYGSKGNIWQSGPSLEEIDDTQIQTHKIKSFPDANFLEVDDKQIQPQKRQRTENGNVNRNISKKTVVPTRKYPSKAVFKCDKCSYSFVSNDHLMSHIKNKHGANRTELNSQKLLSKWANIMNSALDKNVVNKPNTSHRDTNKDEIIIEEDSPITKPANTALVKTVISPPAKRSTLKQLPKLNSNISIQPAKISPPASPQTILKTSSGISIKLNQYPKIDSKVSQSIESSRLSSLSSISISKSTTSTPPTTTISQSVSVLKEKIPDKNATSTKITRVVIGSNSSSRIKIKPSEEPNIVTSKNLLAMPKPAPNYQNNYANSGQEKDVPESELLLRTEDQELAQQEMLFLATPLKCYCCELGRSKMSKSDPSEFFHLQLEMNGQLKKGNPSHRDVENLATYLRVNIGVAKKVLQHVGVTNQTRDSKNRLSLIRRLCWDNMESLGDLCNSFEQVWRAVQMNKDTFNISQEILGHVYRWKFLFKHDLYYQTFMSQVFIHIHQGQNGVYSFMRNEVVDVEID